jgi:hypothetical protein
VIRSGGVDGLGAARVAEERGLEAWPNSPSSQPDAQLHGVRA